MAQIATQIAASEKLALSIPEAAMLSGISRSSLYKRMASGELAAVKSGKRRLILAGALKAWLEALPAA